jgi:hypothetical protein
MESKEWQKQKERLVQGVSDKDLANVRAAGEYQEAYKAISDQLEKASRPSSRSVQGLSRNYLS